MTIIAELTALFEDSIAVKQRSMRDLLPKIEAAGALLTHSLVAGRKLLCCGNGGSAADAQHFAAELVNRFETERSGLAAISLTTDTSTLTSVANDYDFNQVFVKQIHALGRPGDTLVAISTSGNSPNILHAVTAAQSIGMTTIALTGGTGGKIALQLTAQDIELRVASDKTARIQETHILIIHCLCHIIDRYFTNTEHKT